MEPGERLRQIRQRRGMSTADLAARVGRSVSAVRNQENGINGIPASLAAKYAAALGTTAANILYGDDSEAPKLAPELTSLPLLGTVQAGAWLVIDDAAQDEPEYFPAAKDRRYPHARQYLREVRGDSVNALGINEGDLAHLVDFAEAGVRLNTGNIVEVTRYRDSGALREVTLKEVEVLPDGEYLLWPRSTNARWKEPLRWTEGADGQDVEVRVTGLLLAAIKRF